MGRKTKAEQNGENQEPLSNYQNTAITGRNDGTDEDKEKRMQDARDRTDRKAIEIRAAELKNDMFCKFRYLHTVGKNTTNKVTTDSEVPVHPDLVACFRRLDPHLAVICEELEPNDFPDVNMQDSWPAETVERASNFRVTHFRLDGTDETPSVILIGTKKLSTDELIKLETPKIEIGEYVFGMELGSLLQDTVREVEEYMRGKQAANLQPELPFGDEGDDDSQGGYSEPGL